MSAGKTAALAGTALAAFGLVAGGIGYIASPRITQQEAAMRISQGVLTNADVEPGIVWDAWMPGVTYLRLPTTLQKTTVKATEKDSTTIRASENSRIFGSFEIHFMIDKKDPNFGNAYSELKVNSIEDIKPFIDNYGLPAAIDVYQQIPVMEINKDQPGIGKQIAKKLQGYLNDRGYTYIKIQDVIPSGVGLSPEANEMLEQIVKEQRKMTLLQTQGQVADMAKEITAKQTNVTIEAINKLKKEGGMNGDQAVQLYYLQLLHTNDDLGKPNVAGIIPGTGMGTFSPSK